MRGRENCKNLQGGGFFGLSGAAEAAGSDGSAQLLAVGFVPLGSHIGLEVGQHRGDALVSWRQALRGLAAGKLAERLAVEIGCFQKHRQGDVESDGNSFHGPERRIALSFRHVGHERAREIAEHVFDPTGHPLADTVRGARQWEGAHERD